MADYEAILNDAAAHFRELLAQQLQRQTRMEQGEPAKDFSKMEHIVSASFPATESAPSS